MNEEAIPKIENLLEKLNFGAGQTGTGPEAWTAFDVAQKASTLIPDDPALRSLWKYFSQRVNLTTNPAGAKVFARPCTGVDSSWQFMGLTPLDSVLFPSGNISIKIEKKGYEIIEDIISLNSERFDWSYTLDQTGTIPQNMILVRKRDRELSQDSFLIDKYEVSNKAFKKFIAEGGYSNPTYWKYPIFSEGRELEWKVAIQYMVDQTDRQGPSTWEAGDFPTGQENYPVSGISWYEAAAYAAFVGKELPSVYHFQSLVANTALNEIVPRSNYSQQGTSEVGATGVQNRWGILDLFGNVAEWCFNSFGEDKKLILGGAWNDENYVSTFIDNAKPPLDRSNTNGFRCIKLLSPIENYQKKYEGINPKSRRDYFAETPVSDEIFEVYLNQFVYDKIELDPQIIYKKEEEYWIREKIEVSIPYEAGKLTLYLFLPKEKKGPFQTNIFFPHIGARYTDSSEESLLIKTNDFLVKNGRAVVFPVFKGTYERKFPASRKCNDWRVCDKEDKILIAKDLMVSIDYLETRPDIDTQKLAYMGMSLGGTLGGFSLAIEPRIKLGILKMAGFWRRDPFPEVDEFNYHPRVQVPILLLTGELDPYFPYQSSQKPFFESLGTKDEEKRWITYDYGHGVPRTESIKEILNFLDKYFGDSGD